jgi:hypothetical protein
MSWGAQNRPKDAKTPSVAGGRSEALNRIYGQSSDTDKAFGSLLGGAMFSRTYVAISGAKVALAIAHGEPPLQVG